MEVIKKVVMKKMGEDDWGRTVYKDVNTKRLYKDINNVTRKNEPLYLHTCGNSWDGEPCCPIRKDIKIEIIE